MDSNAAKRLIILKGFTHLSVQEIRDLKKLKDFLLSQGIEFDVNKKSQIIENNSNLNDKYIQILRFVEEHIVYETTYFELT